MTRKFATIAAACALCVGAASIAQAQTSPADTGPGANPDDRFQIERVGEDILRLDRTTGEVQLCAQSQPMFTCRTVVRREAPEGERGFPASGEMLAENQALKAEVEVLKQRLGMIKALVDDVDPVAVDAGSGNTRRRDLKEAIDVTDYAFRRFRDLVKSLNEDEETGR
ncbi:hypothetical protein RDV64_02550 [Acuticoccus sp. MNP-M23]|uniref:hypothetical protein n=1 Tax=Acuticoccus sp. MNP-M23 TaxID=3072793 RepID=UPI0028155697|nr:hypothetical protein [Acuticoccus sp. MNP-M23]WMS43303.1 hypothetical protein RDV64_02550 [Acuticoccus sp. MNP-M23]